MKTIKITHLILLTILAYLFTACDGNNIDSTPAPVVSPIIVPTPPPVIPPIVIVPAPTPVYDIYVDAVSGDDALNDGSEASPYLTIRKALSVVDINGSIKVNPGLYDGMHGEVFPLDVPEGVSLVGNILKKGVDTVNTEINGGDSNAISTTLRMRNNSSISGFRIVNTNSTPTYPVGIVLGYGDNVTIHRNTLTGNYTAIYVIDTVAHIITENNITRNDGIGIAFVRGAEDVRVENNSITYNSIGVELDVLGGDLGGGNMGSVGGNIISCNSRNDLWTNISGDTINAQNNIWDHTPPMDNDIYNYNGTPINLGGASLANSPCI